MTYFYEEIVLFFIDSKSLLLLREIYLRYFSYTFLFNSLSKLFLFM